MTVGAGDYLDLIRYHKCGVESDAELTDNVYLALTLTVTLKVERAALCDSAEIVLEIIHTHAAAVVADFEYSFLFINIKEDCVVRAVKADSRICQ